MRQWILGLTLLSSVAFASSPATQPSAQANTRPCIADLVSTLPQFSTLKVALTEAGLVDVFKDKKARYTVFAPTNDAFAKVPKETLDTLLGNKELLTKVLTYHVVKGAITSPSVVRQKNGLLTLQGEKIQVTVGSDVLLDEAKLLQADVRACNGVVHVIDSVLVPMEVMEALNEPAPGMGATAPVAPAPECKDIVDIAAGNPAFSTLVTAVKAAGLVDTLKSAGPFTVFAPTNDAFAKIPADTLNGLLADKPALTRVLTYHVVAGKAMAADVVKLTEVKMVSGDTARVMVMDGKVMLDNANVIQTDIQACNGVIHVLDSVVLPPM